MNTEQFTGHTPGPWQVDRNVTKKGVLGVTADAAPCIIAHGFSEKHWPSIAAANAALIAAAPELLKQREELEEALQACANSLRTFRNVPADEQMWTSFDEDAIDRAFVLLERKKTRTQSHV